MADIQSTGRGGAGNIGDAAKSPKVQPQDLETPTLKTPVYTTGRGGSGNMATNSDPEEARAAQDVNVIARTDSNTPTHTGRGGQGNITKGDGEVPIPGANGDKAKTEKKGLLTKIKEIFSKN